MSAALLTVKAAVLTNSANWNPRQVPGLKLWLDPWQLGLADGATVATWPDSSGSGNSATAVNSPTYGQSRINGRPAVVLASASSQYLTANGIATLLTGQDVPFTWVSVNRIPTPSGTQSLMSLGSSASANPLHRLEAASSQWQMTRRSDSAGADTASITAGTAAGVGTIVATRFTGTVAQLFANGAQLGADTAMDVNLLTVDRFALGAQVRTTVNNYVNGDLGDQLVWNRALTLSELARVVRWLGQRWSIATA